MLRTRRPVMAQKRFERIHIAASAGERDRNIANACHMCPTSGPQLNHRSLKSQTNELTFNRYMSPVAIWLSRTSEAL